MYKKMFLKLALGAVVVSSAFAGDCGVKSGAYAGISAGVSHLGGKNEFKVSNSDVQSIHGAKGKLSSNGILAGVFAGYGYKLNSFWLAGELGYSFDNLDSKFDYVINAESSYSIKLKSKSRGAFFGACHLGILANSSAVVYAILGLESRSFNVQFSDAVNHFNPDLQLVKKNYRSAAFVPGLGIRLNISKNLALRTEYKCAMHRMKNFAKSAADTAAGMYAGGTTTVSVKHKPMVQSLSVGVAYTF